MSRALSSAVLSLVALTSAGATAQADFRGRVAPGQGAFAAAPAKPLAPAVREARRDRLVGAPVGRFVTEPVWRTERTIIQVIQEEPPGRRLRMRSGHPIDPGATIRRAPSGRIVIGPPPGLLLTAPLAQGAVAQPYAPPEFTIIGAPSSRNMGSPVRLTHGVKPPETLQTGPKVVWLDQTGDDAGGRVKRLR